MQRWISNVPTRPVTGLWLGLLVLAPAVAGAETCRFAGTTSQNGHLAVQTTTAQAAGLTTVGVTVEFTIHAWMTDYRYLGQEITTWRGTELQSIALNQRSLADGDIKRQQWDVFTRAGPRLDAYRVQAKHLADFRQRHPGFVAHWPPANFAQPWLDDYRRAGAERRPDLDLPAAGARTPLAFAFYWSRFLPPAGTRVAVVLPSFKQNKVTTLDLAAAVQGEGWLRWSTELHHPSLEASPASLAAAWVSPDHYLLQLGVDLHTSWASGRAMLRAEGCEGIQIMPDG